MKNIKKISIIDYGMGNVHSVYNALKYIGHDSKIIDSSDKIKTSDIIIFPGVGAFGEGMEELKKRDLISPLLGHINSGKPFLGLCLGMHLLFETSEEHGFFEGLGVFKGRVIRFDKNLNEKGLKIPHMGWNSINIISKDNKMLEDMDKQYFYFVHSYYVIPEDNDIIAGTTDYGIEFCSIVLKDNICAMQFHPEKSQKIGLKLLDNFIKYQ